MLLFVVVVTTWQQRVNLQLSTFVPLALAYVIVCSFRIDRFKPERLLNLDEKAEAQRYIRK